MSISTLSVAEARRCVPSPAPASSSTLPASAQATTRASSPRRDRSARPVAGRARRSCAAPAPDRSARPGSAGRERATRSPQIQTINTLPLTTTTAPHPPHLRISVVASAGRQRTRVERRSRVDQHVPASGTATTRASPHAQLDQHLPAWVGDNVRSPG
ncbi:hypothetical protein HBB16_07855 [Pseudonocardia sp. MCCB 268]|nr:hypothetical protein [Pseudonocardia cytotoxica]